MPTATAAAPASSAARTWSGVPTPPAATSGSAVTARTARTSAGSASRSGGACGVSVPQWPPASADCTTRASTPASTACLASSGEVTVCTSVQPARRSAAADAGSGRPKVNETTGGAAATSTSTLAAQASSSSTGSAGRSTAYRSASGRSSSR